MASLFQTKLKNVDRVRAKVDPPQHVVTVDTTRIVEESRTAIGKAYRTPAKPMV
jgi:hypothetical protein